VKERTNGNIDIQVFYSSALGGDREMFEALTRGDHVLDVINPISATDKRLDAVNLPFLVTNYDQVDKLYYGDGIVKKLTNDIYMSHGIRVIGASDNDFRHLSNSVRPIKSVADMKGLKFRVPQTEAFVSMFTAWGSLPVAMAFPEVYSALQLKTIDGQDNGYALTYTTKIFEVQKYFTELGHYFNASWWVIKDDVWQKLSPEHKEIITKAAEEATSEARTKFRSQIAEYKRSAVADYKVEITELSPEAIAEFRNMTKEQVWPMFIKAAGEEGPALWAQVEAQAPWLK
jgi:tripartite ATP-independent transporter DctP family solute receptor